MTSRLLHTREQGLRVHGLANLGGLLAIAGLEEVEPDLLLGALLEVAERLPQLRPERRGSIAERGKEALQRRNAEKRAWRARERARDLHAVDLTSDQIRELVRALGVEPPAERELLVPVLSETLAAAARPRRG